mmetsp:Transcript_35958/g.73927  ORF Transcript_35958/g.73927 Transcript_35958/m.73927 type:complete len:114 (+) Transcript_35958:594-935(+)
MIWVIRSSLEVHPYLQGEYNLEFAHMDQTCQRDITGKVNAKVIPLMSFCRNSFVSKAWALVKRKWNGEKEGAGQIVLQFLLLQLQLEIIANGAKPFVPLVPTPEPVVHGTLAV